MNFSHSQTVHRDRRKIASNPYNPSRATTGSWDDPDSIPLPGAFVATSSQTSTVGAKREQVMTEKSLYLTEVTADVLPGDRIRVGTETFYVREIPTADVNPFTGWQPVKEVPLHGTLG